MYPLLSFFIKGFILGFSIAAPVGPIGVLCIRRTLAQGLLVGVACGLGAALGDAMYGLIAGFGLTMVSNFLVAQKFWLGVVGGLFLGYLGIKIFFSAPSQNAARTAGSGYLEAFLSTFLLTITNPMTILSFIAIFAGLGIVNNSGSYESALALVGGVFAGSAAWFLTLCGAVATIRHKITNQWLGRINRVSGLIILGFAVVILINALKAF